MITVIFVFKNGTYSSFRIIVCAYIMVDFLQSRMSHVLQFEEQTRKVKDANMQDEDTFEIHDPRNPVNKRRREESKKIMKEKKERR